MKKISILVIIIVVIGISFFYLSKNKIEPVYDGVVIEDVNTSVNVVIDKDISPTDESDESIVSKDELKDMSEYLDKIETDWNGEIENFFMSDPENGETLVQLYRELKRGFEQERERRYAIFHQQMKQKHGENYSYPPSSDEEMFNEKLVKEYEKVLSEKIGKEKMINYMTLKDTFNNKLEKNSSGDDEFFTLIEF